MLRFLEGTSRDQILVEAAEHLTHTRHMTAVNKLLGKRQLLHLLAGEVVLASLKINEL
jgi:hypothetical protein